MSSLFFSQIGSKQARHYTTIISFFKQKYLSLLFLKMGHPRPLLYLFSSFQTNITILTTNKCEKCPSSIRCWDSNSQPSEHKSPPITTRPGLPSVSLFNRPFSYKISGPSQSGKEAWQKYFRGKMKFLIQAQKRRNRIKSHVKTF